jgi:hypothetical protein
MSKATYSEKLKDHRWLKVRAEKLKEAEHTCQCCGESEMETYDMHVHHLVYIGENPWNTPLEYLEALCVSCHRYRHEQNKEILFLLNSCPTKQFEEFHMWLNKLLRNENLGYLADNALTKMPPNMNAAIITKLTDMVKREIKDPMRFHEFEREMVTNDA